MCTPRFVWIRRYVVWLLLLIAIAIIMTLAALLIPFGLGEQHLSRQLEFTRFLIDVDELHVDFVALV